MKFAKITATALLISCALTSVRASFGQSVEVTIDGTRPRQVMEGFGASQSSHVFAFDLLTPNKRARTLDAVYNQIKIRIGQVPTLIEAPSIGENFYAHRTNDNSDPFIINWSGFNTSPGDRFKQKVVDLLPPAATAELFPDVHVNIKWVSPWLKALRHSDQDRFLNEVSEQVVAGVTYWNKTYGREPRFAFLFNEPLTGNGELDEGSIQEIVDIIVRAGERLRRAGFKTVKFIAPNEETVAGSISAARAIMEDKKARQYIGAVGYHPYPYGSVYSSVPRILSTSGSGHPSQDEIDVRRKLAALASEFGIPVWMTEVSNGLHGTKAVDVQSFDVLRARAIHIHDELEYANASAYFGMNSIWSTYANLEHFGSRQIDNNPDDLVYVYQDNDQVLISGTGYAIGHYARWLKQGAVRIDSVSTDPLVLISAFRNEDQTMTMVAINNSSVVKTIKVNLRGISISGQLKGEQSTAGRYWDALSPIKTQSPASFLIILPPLSVTSLAG